MSPSGTRSQRWTLVAAILGSGMAFMDGTVVNVALPAIQRSLDASGADAQWVVESYALFLAALLLVGGALGDRIGRRRAFLAGTAVFVAASAACACAQVAWQLIGARALQGIGAALLVPGSLALLSAGFAERERGRAIGTWSAFSGITAAAGPVVGGLLVDHLSWRWAFLLNVPIGLVLIALCLARVPESRDAQAGAAVDARGATAVTLGLAGLVFALIEAPRRGWTSATVLAAALLGVLALAGFAWLESRLAAPMLPPALFRNRQFAAANLLTLLLYAALGAALYFLPLDLIQVQGYTAAEAGAALLPVVVVMFALSRWSGTLVDVAGARVPLVAGPAIAALGLAAFAWPGVGGRYWVTFFPGLLLLGLGMGITVAPLTTSVMNAVGSALAGTASGVNNAVARTAGLLAIAALGAVLAAQFDTRLHDALREARLPGPLVDAVYAQRSKFAALAPPVEASGADAIRIRQAVDTAFVAGFRSVMLTCAALALAGAASAWFMMDGRRTRRAPQPGSTT